MCRTHNFYINIGYKSLNKKIEILKVKSTDKMNGFGQYNSKDECESVLRVYSLI